MTGIISVKGMEGLSEELKGTHEDIWGSTLGRGSSQCQGPEVVWQVMSRAGADDEGRVRR